ncbi:GntR family transcriptional regulator [Carnobacterium iners]|uniref:GntR family transcriptional regulator n=1 Tax=Carnobacterium iners TaxID=1073423 RepID=UPI000A1C8FDB
MKLDVITKQLLPEETLPSVRILAGDIGINMYTISKVYKQLEFKGILLNLKK